MSLEASVSFSFGNYSGIDFYYESEVVEFSFVLDFEHELKEDTVANTVYNRHSLLQENKKWMNFYNSIVRGERVEEEAFGDMKFSYDPESSKVEIIGMGDYKFPKAIILPVFQDVIEQIEQERKRLADKKKADDERKRIAKAKAERDALAQAEFVARAASAGARPECNVCYENFEGTILECGHWTCEGCLVKFSKAECAMCRRPLTQLKPSIAQSIRDTAERNRIARQREQIRDAELARILAREVVDDLPAVPRVISIHQLDADMAAIQNHLSETREIQNEMTNTVPRVISIHQLRADMAAIQNHLSGTREVQQQMANTLSGVQNEMSNPFR